MFLSREVITLPKRYIPIIIFTSVLTAVAIVGYLLPSASPPLPQRILFDNAGGKLVFEHARHTRDYKLSCERCHHEHPAPREEVQKCSSCHGVLFDDSFKKTHTEKIQDAASCVTCHHIEFKGLNPKWDHNAHQAIADCTDCHHDNKNAAADKQECSACHSTKGDTSVPSLREAAHGKCISCHEDLFAKKLPGCAECHNTAKTRDTLKNGQKTVKLNPAYTDCTVCHTESTPADLVPERMAAFHKSCMGCHEKTGKGPYTKQHCKQCHMK